MGGGVNDKGDGGVRVEETAESRKDWREREREET